MNKAQLDARLEAANPVTVGSAQIDIKRSMIVRIARLTLGVLATMSIGVGVAWATSGSNPIDSIFSNDLEVIRSDVGFRSFSSLQPMTQESLDGLPRGVAQMAIFQALGDSVSERRTVARKPTPANRMAVQLDPATLSAVARVRTNRGTPAILLVVDNEICSFTEANDYGTTNCSTPQEIRDGQVINWRSEPWNPGLRRVEALFDDRVVAIDILEDLSPPVPVENNVLELRNLEKQDLTFVGLDNEGKELFRNKISLNEHP